MQSLAWRRRHDVTDRVCYTTASKHQTSGREPEEVFASWLQRLTAGVSLHAAKHRNRHTPSHTHTLQYAFSLQCRDDFRQHSYVIRTYLPKLSKNGLGGNVRVLLSIFSPYLTGVWGMKGINKTCQNEAGTIHYQGILMQMWTSEILMQKQTIWIFDFWPAAVVLRMMSSVIAASVNLYLCLWR